MSIPLQVVSPVTSHLFHQSYKRQIVLVGQPNVGKSLLFNQLTGADQRIANFPGITLSYTHGSFLNDSTRYELVDLPGFYSFSASKTEELTAIDFLTSSNNDLLINVIDVRKLEMNLSLTLQLLELKKNMIVVLTHIDKVDLTGVNVDKLSLLLKCPVYAINSHNRAQVAKLKKQIGHYYKEKITQSAIHNFELARSENILSKIESEISLVPNDEISTSSRWIIIHTLLAGTKVTSYPAFITSEITALLPSEHQVKLNLIHDFYDIASQLASDVQDSNSRKSNFLKNSLDKQITHPYWGLLIFVMVMTSMFVLTFYLTDPLNIVLENVLSNLADIIHNSIQSPFLASLLADGIVGGIGFVMVFIPQITVLFLFMGILEQSGYMTRVVFVMDQYLSRLGISGPSIAPLLLGLGCNVPGIMATRAIPDNNERIAIAFVNPFVSCSARLPVYVIISSAIFPSYAGWVVASLYFLGISTALITLYILRKTVLPGESQFLLMELPELDRPVLNSVMLYAYRHLKQFIKAAGSWMSVGILLLWFLSITGPTGYLGPEALIDTQLMESNWISVIGSFIAPIFGPMNWDKRLIVALLLGFVAKEIVIGSLGLLYGVQTANIGPVLMGAFTPVTAYAFMVFVLLYTPCIGAYMTMRSQLGKKWANLSVIFSLVLAYAISLFVIAIGTTL